MHARSYLISAVIASSAIGCGGTKEPAPDRTAFTRLYEATIARVRERLPAGDSARFARIADTAGIRRNGDTLSFGSEGTSVYMIHDTAFVTGVYELHGKAGVYQAELRRDGHRWVGATGDDREDLRMQ